MKKAICGMLAVSMLCGLSLTGCGSKNVTVKNTLPQEFSSYSEDGTLASTLTITDVSYTWEDDNHLTVDVTGEWTTVVEGTWVTPSVDIRILDEDGEEVNTGLGSIHIIDSMKEGDAYTDSWSMELSENGDYQIELYDSKAE